MKVVTRPAVSFMGVTLGRAKHYLTLNKQELATLKRAQTIREEVRDRLSATLGVDGFEGSGFYVLTIDDLLDGSVWWDDLDIDDGGTL